LARAKEFDHLASNGSLSQPKLAKVILSSVSNHDGGELAGAEEPVEQEKEDNWPTI